MMVLGTVSGSSTSCSIPFLIRRLLDSASCRHVNDEMTCRTGEPAGGRACFPAAGGLCVAPSAGRRTGKRT